MTYVVNSPTWANETGIGDGTPFTALRMNHIEDGIVSVDTALGALTAGGTIDGGGPSTNHVGNLRIDFGSVT